MYRHDEQPLERIGLAFVIALIVPLGLSCMVFMRGITGQNVPFYIMLTIIGSWVTDIGAYFTGTFFGKHKMAPKISPKKTVEGLFGGLVLCIACFALWGWLYQTLFLQDGGTVQFLPLMLLSIPASLGMGQRMGMLHVGRILDQLATEFVGDFKGLLNRAVDARVGRRVKGNVQLKIQPELFGLRLNRGQMPVGKVVVQVDQRHMDDLDPLFHAHIHQLVEVDDFLKLKGFSLALEAPAFAQAAQVQGHFGRRS